MNAFCMMESMRICTSPFAPSQGEYKNIINQALDEFYDLRQAQDEWH